MFCLDDIWEFGNTQMVVSFFYLWIETLVSSGPLPFCSFPCLPSDGSANDFKHWSIIRGRIIKNRSKWFPNSFFNFNCQKLFFFKFYLYFHNGKVVLLTSILQHQTVTLQFVCQFWLHFYTFTLIYKVSDLSVPYVKNGCHIPFPSSDF